VNASTNGKRQPVLPPKPASFAVKRRVRSLPILTENGRKPKRQTAPKRVLKVAPAYAVIPNQESFLSEITAILTHVIRAAIFRAALIREKYRTSLTTVAMILVIQSAADIRGKQAMPTITLVTRPAISQAAALQE
jgi:hypothetical protein